MTNDYRITKYEKEFQNISEKKQSLRDEIKKEKPRVEDFHTYISDNDGEYKSKFMRIYNCKCSYCGISLDIVSKTFFEIDHFIYQKAPQFKTKKEAGFIENLVLACHNCNHKKSGFIVSDEVYDKLYPDCDTIKSTFERNEDFYIRMADIDDKAVEQFYNQLGLGDELRRIDYLLMSIIGLEEKLRQAGLAEAYMKLDEMYKFLIRKRNEFEI